MACHGDPDPPKPVAPEPAAPVVNHGADPARPELAPESDAGIATTEQVFAAESVDYAWKGRTEPEIRKRLVKQTPAEIECRQTQCRLTFVGDTATLEHVLDDLSPLAGFAHNVKLTAMQPRSDGKLELRVYARFE